MIGLYFSASVKIHANIDAQVANLERINVKHPTRTTLINVGQVWLGMHINVLKGRGGGLV